ncbi:MAG: CpXC domain-containing protein [Anaerolineales bacterium]
MAPIRMQVPCPNCRTPVLANVEQLFDVAQDPSAKQRFLSGRFNQINCPNCRYQGQVSTVLLYHDADKELLLSYVPMELGLPQAEQERAIGKLVNEVINKLPQEKRKGYLLNPKPALTLQGMIERVLEGEGITKEALDAQRAKAQLIQQFLAAPEDQWPELVKQHDASLDAAFFQLLLASTEATAASGSQAGTQQMLNLRDKLLQLSSFGAQARRRQKTLEEAARELQALGDKLTQDKLLDLVVKAENDDRVIAYVSLANQIMDYAFFEALTKRIDKAKGEEKDRLTKLRETILQLTQEIEQVEQARVAEAADLLRTLLEAPDLNQALMDNLPRIDDTFMAVLNANLDAASKAGRKDVVQKLTQVNESIAQLMQEAAPPEIRFINELLQMGSEAEAAAELKRRSGEISQQLIEAMNYISESLRQEQGQPQLADRLDKLRDLALGEVMAANWKK